MLAQNKKTFYEQSKLPLKNSAADFLKRQKFVIKLDQIAP